MGGIYVSETFLVFQIYVKSTPQHIDEIDPHNKKKICTEKKIQKIKNI